MNLIGSLCTGPSGILLQLWEMPENHPNRVDNGPRFEAKYGLVLGGPPLWWPVNMLFTQEGKEVNVQFVDFSLLREWKRQPDGSLTPP